MKKEIRIYVEGGGDDPAAHVQFRRGLDEFLNRVKELAREKKVKWQVVACGSRKSAYDDFKTALKKHPNAFNILLVDSEGPVADNDAPWEHLKKRDNWKRLTNDENRCHLMVQEMEAWLCADVEALADFYGQGFNAKAIPGYPNVEEIPKPDLVPALNAATKQTKIGKYRKMPDGPKILGKLNEEKVRSRARHCDLLFQTLESEIG